MGSPGDGCCELGPLDGIHEMVNETEALGWIPHPTCYESPRLLSHADPFSALCGTRKNWASWAASHNDGKSGWNLLTFSFSVTEGMVGWEHLSWYWNVSPWGRDDAGKWNCSCYSPQCIYSWFFSFFCSNGKLDSQAITKVFPSLSGLKNQCVYGGEMRPEHSFLHSWYNNVEFLIELSA